MLLDILRGYSHRMQNHRAKARDTVKTTFNVTAIFFRILSKDKTLQKIYNVTTMI